MLTKQEYEEYWFTWNYFTTYPASSLIMFLQMFPFETISFKTVEYLNYLNHENIPNLYYHNKYDIIKPNDLIIYLLIEQCIILAYESKKTFMNKLYYLFEYIYNMYKIVIIGSDILESIFSRIFNNYSFYKCNKKYDLKDIINRLKENSIPIIYTSNDFYYYKIKCYWFFNPIIYNEYYIKNIQKQNIKILPDHLEALFKLKKPLKIRSKSRKERHRPKLYL
jgi:hypothetical protein